MAKRQQTNKIDDMIAQETIIEKDINDEMKNSFLIYSIMTYRERALPDVRDGLKPVQRRILYSMWKQGIISSSGYKKAARIVGDVLGKYHPHGDTSCYGALCNMVNDFDTRYPFIDGQGNFGSVDGDGAAAMRYTEARLQKLAGEMLRDIDANAVNMIPNFSEDELEPEILPGLPPQVLINGAEGIATGYTTSIPPHNLSEVSDAIIAYIKNPKLSIEKLVKTYLHGPDLASAGYLINDDNIVQLYKTGQATLKFQGKMDLEIDPDTGDRLLVISELPPGIKKPSLMEKLYNDFIVAKDKRVTGVSDASEGDTIRIILELHKTAVPELVMKDAFKYITKTKSYILRAVVNQAPLLLNLTEIIEHYLDHRRGVIQRRTKFYLDKINKDIEKTNGLVIASNNIKTMIDIISNSKSPSDAASQLKIKYNLTDLQAKAILDKRLSSLTQMEVNKLLDDLKDLQKQQVELNAIISSTTSVDNVIIDELKTLKKTYGDARKTRIIDTTQEVIDSVAPTISDEPMFVGLTSKNQIKVVPYTSFEKMAKNKVVKEKTNIFKQGLKANMSDNFIIIFSDGTYNKLSFAELEIQSFTATQNVVGILIDSDSENVIVAVSKNGMVKKIKFNSFKTKNNKITQFFNLVDDDKIIAIRVAEDNEDNVVNIVTNNGLIHRFFLRGFSATSITAQPLGCINKDDDDYIVAFDITNVKNDSVGITILYNKHQSGKNSIKYIKLDEFTIKNRMAKGTKAISYVKKDVGNTTDAVITTTDFFIINNNGEILLTKLSTVKSTDKTDKPIDVDYEVLSSKFLL